RALCEDPGLAGSLLRIQRELFAVGADLATAPGQREKLVAGVSLTSAELVERLETEIDAEVNRKPLPQEFIVPGANPVSAALDVARATARRAERRSVELGELGVEVNPEVVRYLNRLSDLLFVLARSAAGGAEPPSRGDQ
ncbi:MAG: ATP:cob(I)alamin adenosyltransferase, partial [Actinomycetota bacterium]|nr:ATP:cob(I)alamin adenosyltransferase [Actinomycetota bacterium]